MSTDPAANNRTARGQHGRSARARGRAGARAAWQKRARAWNALVVPGCSKSWHTAASSSARQSISSSSPFRTERSVRNSQHACMIMNAC